MRRAGHLVRTDIDKTAKSAESETPIPQEKAVVVNELRDAGYICRSDEEIEKFYNQLNAASSLVMDRPSGSQCNRVLDGVYSLAHPLLGRHRLGYAENYIR